MPPVPASVPSPATPRSRGLPWGRLLVLAALLVAVVVAGRRAAALVPAFAAYINGLGTLGAVVFVVGYALACVAFIPGSLLTLAAGAIFGLAKGVALVFVGATLGSTLAFLIARYAARGWIERKLAGNARFAAIDRAIGADGRRIVTLLRLSPAFPFSLLNYALGLTQVRLADYLVAALGMLPGTVLYVYYGRLAGDVAALASGAQAPKDAGYYAVLGLGLAATILVTALVTRTARRALRDATEGPAALPGSASP
ncbi:MAG: TVP38/TMEM64 family protein [Gemmatimonadetes bacterium]|nr:TVP38/TMEM64 family protein [Gemmatimonadota bacterium]